VRRGSALAGAALAALALGCTHEPAGPPPRCADAWARVPEAARTYDWARDPKLTARGNEGYARYADRLPRRGCTKDWTVLVYMAADAADLGAPADRDLRSMETPFADPLTSAASTVRADVVVQLDRAAPPGIQRLHLFRAAKEAAVVQSPIVEALDEETLAPEESLRRFVSWGVERYPADRYAIVVWGHGLGWRPASAAPGPAHYDRDGTAGGLAFDESQGTVLDTPGLAGALAAVSRERLGGRPFDLYASDACLMQSVEVAGALAGVARYVVGSEQIEEDYVGLPYRSWLPALNGTAPPPPAAAPCAPADVACLAAAVLPSLHRAAAERSAAGAPGVVTSTSDGYTLSAVDEAGLSRELVPSLRRLGAALDAYQRADDLRRIGLQVLLGEEHGELRGTPGFRGGTRDLGVFLDRLAAQVQREPVARDPASASAVLSAVGAVRAALGHAVLAATFGPRYRAPGFASMAGLSLWLPRDAADYRDRVAFFAPSVLYQAPPGEPSLRGFLDRLFAPPRS
jgi:hypothetical protein